MTTELRFPRIEGSATGTFSRWVFEDGATVSVGELLNYAELGDCILEVESPGNGQLQTLGEPGVTYNAGDLVGIITHAGLK